MQKLGDNVAYDNIVKAIQGKPGDGLTPAQQADNYDLFGKMMKEGVYLPDLIKKIDGLEKRVEDLSKPKDNPIDAQLFSVMEQAVRDDPAVVEARRKLQAEKTRIISELCMQDDAYRNFFTDYKTAVNSAYIKYKEQS